MLNQAQNDPHDVKVERILQRMRERCAASGLSISDAVLAALTSAALKGIEDVDGKPLTSTSHPNDALINRVAAALRAFFESKKSVIEPRLSHELATVAVNECDKAASELELNEDNVEQVEINLPQRIDLPSRGSGMLVIHRQDGTIDIQRARL